MKRYVGSWIGAMVLFLLAVGVVGCAPTAAAMEGPMPESHQDAAALVPHDGLLTVRANEFRFEPPVIRVRAGEPVKLALVNIGALEHELEIEGLPAAASGHEADEQPHEATNEHGEGQAAGNEPGHGARGAIHLHTEKGQQAMAEFVAPEEPGRYVFACNIPGHREGGMVGTLIVE